MIKPLNNNCLIEIIDENDGIISGNSDQNVQKGKLLDYVLTSWHLTASTGFSLGDDIFQVAEALKKQVNKTVYWQEYADSGSKFTIDGKDYVLVPFYRLIGFEE